MQTKHAQYLTYQVLFCKRADDFGMGHCLALQGREGPRDWLTDFRSGVLGLGFLFPPTGFRVRATGLRGLGV